MCHSVASKLESRRCVFGSQKLQQLRGPFPTSNRSFDRRFLPHMHCHPIHLTSLAAKGSSIMSIPVSPSWSYSSRFLGSDSTCSFRRERKTKRAERLTTMTKTRLKGNVGCQAKINPSRCFLLPRPPRPLFSTHDGEHRKTCRSTQRIRLASRCSPRNINTNVVIVTQTATQALSECFARCDAP